MSNRHYSVKEQDVEKFNSKLLSISNARDEGDWKSIPHTHPFTELFFVSDGKGSFLFDQTTHSIYPGDLVIIPPYTEHTERSLPNQPLEYYVLGIDGISFLASDKTTGQIICNFNDDTSIFNLFRQMLQEIRNSQYGSEAICQRLLEILNPGIHQLCPHYQRMCPDQGVPGRQLREPDHSGYADESDSYE